MNKRLVAVPLWFLTGWMVAAMAAFVLGLPGWIAPVSAVVVAAGTPPDAPTLRLAFATPQRAVTPGQSAVVFSGERVLGGGRIAETLRGALASA